jgi:hypothetical protein
LQGVAVQDDERIVAAGASLAGEPGPWPARRYGCSVRREVPGDRLRGANVRSSRRPIVAAAARCRTRVIIGHGLDHWPNQLEDRFRADICQTDQAREAWSIAERKRSSVLVNDRG